MFTYLLAFPHTPGSFTEHQASLPDGAELQEAVEELVSDAREYAALDSAIDRPNWFGPC